MAVYSVGTGFFVRIQVGLLDGKEDGTAKVDMEVEDSIVGVVATIVGCGDDSIRAWGYQG